jgi:uncharacterized protein
VEHLLLSERSADRVVVAVDDDGLPFRLAYRLNWDGDGRLLGADLRTIKGSSERLLSLRVEAGRWSDARDARLSHLDGCIDIDIWPTPLTNSFPIWRSDLQVGERREFLMAWVAAPDLTVEPQPQAYTRLADSTYLFESLDGSGFKVELSVDAYGVVLDYPGLFRRVGLDADSTTD